MNVTLQPKLLHWARERAGLDVDVLAKKLATKAERVTEWERTGEISWKKAEKLAHVTHVPFGYLFLEEPPEEALPVADYRTLRGERSQPSPELLDVLYDAMRKQDWYREYLLDLDADPLEYVGSAQLKEKPEAVAARIRARFDLNGGWRNESGTWEQALTLLFHQCEEHGLMVLRSGVALGNSHRPLEVEEFRGFALTDSYAPLVFINSKDSPAAQMFTLVHELAHIWLGVSGVSNLEKGTMPASKVERFCNQVAGEVLVPLPALNAEFRPGAELGEELARLRRYFRVSTLVLLYRLRDIGHLEEETFQIWYDREEQAFQEKKANQKSGGHYFNTQQARVSPNFARAVIGSALEGRTLYRDAYNLLGVKSNETFRKFATHLNVEI